MRSLFLMDPRGRVFDLKEKILYFLVALFFITLLLPDMPVLNNIVIGAILLFSFFYNTLTEKRRLLRQRKEIIFLFLFFLIHILSVFLSVNKQEAVNMLILRAPLLIFPLSIGLLTIRPALKNRILLAFAILVTLTALVCLTSACSQYSRTHDASLFYDDSLTEAIRRQSIYFALLVNLALFSYVYLLRHPDFVMKYPGLTWIAIVFLLVFQFLLASRIAIIVLCSSLLIFAGYYIVKKRKFLEGATLVMGLLIGGVILVKSFPKTLNRFRELKYTGYTYHSEAAESHYNMELTADQWNGANIRLAVWRCGWDLVRQHPVIGVQLGDKQERLMDVYRARQFDFAIRTHRNMHNNYLDILCCFGVIGLAIFLAGFLVFPLMSCSRNDDWLGMFTVLAFAASMITETYFDRSIGCLLAGFFFCFIAACQSPGNRSGISKIPGTTKAPTGGG